MESRKAARIQAAIDLQLKQDAMIKRQQQELKSQQEEQALEKEDQLELEMTEEERKQAKRVRKHARAALLEGHRTETDREVSGLAGVKKKTEETEREEDARDMEIEPDAGPEEGVVIAASGSKSNSHAGSGACEASGDVVPLVAVGPSLLQLVHCCRLAAAVAQAAAAGCDAGSLAPVSALRELVEQGKDLVGGGFGARWIRDGVSRTHEERKVHSP